MPGPRLDMNYIFECSPRYLTEDFRPLSEVFRNFSKWFRRLDERFRRLSKISEDNIIFPRRDQLYFHHTATHLSTFLRDYVAIYGKSNMLFSGVKAHLIFHWCSYNKRYY